MMLSSDDVFDVKWFERLRLRQATILARIASSPPDEPLKVFVHVSSTIAVPSTA